MDTPLATPHLTDAELFGLAIPAAGIPEALPAHLSDCLECARSLSEWKAAVRDLVRDAGPLDRRSAAEWTLAEDRTREAIRRAAGRRRALPLRWAVGIAASLLIALLAIPLRHAAPRSPGSAAAPDATSPALSAQDQADDMLLRDVARMSRADDSEGAGSWSTLAPEPGAGGRDEERL